VAAEFVEQAGMVCGHGIEGVADVQARYRARRAFNLIVTRQCERNHRAVHAVFDARGENADDALVPGFIEQT
jgi:hypothetical protein